MKLWEVWLSLTVFFGLSAGVRISFSSCQNTEWSCVNNIPTEIVYTCSFSRSHNFVLYLKDYYYIDNITSITVQNCRDLRVVLDCPVLLRPSQLQRIKIKECDKLEFISLSSSSSLQSPPDVAIENVKEIVSFPRGIFKSPNSNNELKCLGSSSLKSIRITNSKLNSIQSRAIYNVTGIKDIIFDNVTITEIQTQGIEALMGNSDTLFKMVNSNLNNVFYKAITVQSKTVAFTENIVGDLTSNAVNISSDYLYVKDNKFKEIRANALVFQSVSTEITDNTINSLKSYAFSNIKCARKSCGLGRNFIFSRNKIQVVEPHSFIIDFMGCKSIGAVVIFKENKIDCRCRNIAFLNSGTNELYSSILSLSNNNTCIAAPCVLPLEIIKLLLESHMCQIILDSQVMCLLYNDRHLQTNEVTTDEEITEPSPTFYLIRQANSQNNPSAMTDVNRDAILKESNFNMTNRTTVKVVFDSSRDFVETLRSTSSSRKRPVEASTPRSEYINSCVGSHCRNNVAYDRQKALDFYKYVYAQLRPPTINDKKKKT